MKAQSPQKLKTPKGEKKKKRERREGAAGSWEGVDDRRSSL